MELLGGCFISKSHIDTTEDPEELPPPPKLRRIDPVRERLKELATEGAAEGAEDGDPSPER